MKFSRSAAISAILIVIAVAVGVWLYPQLPPRVPVHWDLHGDVDRWMPPFWAAAWLPLTVLGLAVMTWVLLVISPRKFEIRPFAKIYGGLMLVIQGTALVVGVCALLAGAGYALPLQTITMLAVGVLLMVLGNYMGKLRKNFFIGIRTPWTLASDAVWERTHRMGGWTFMLGGLVLIVGSLAGGSQWPMIAALVIAAGIPVVYSFIIYLRLERGRKSSGGNA